jgi:hypothetical protein
LHRRAANAGNFEIDFIDKSMTSCDSPGVAAAAWRYTFILTEWQKFIFVTSGRRCKIITLSEKS